MNAKPMSVPGFLPLPDDNDPLGLLEACHLRMSRQLLTLERLLARQQPRDGGASVAVDAEVGAAEVGAAATAVCRYFDEAASRHHRDEEQDLFPAVVESMAGSDAVCLRGMVGRLADEHRRLEAAWQALRPTIAALAAGESSQLDAAVVTRFVTAYREHLAYEDAELMPMARRLLSDDQVSKIGLAMRARRERR